MNRSILCSTLALALASATAAAQGNPKPDSTPKPTAGLRVPASAYRNRIIGVFDAQTFQPVEGAEVSNVMVGTKSLTSITGNVSLFFLPEGTSLVRIRKLGYEAQTFMVSIAPQDSSPILVVLSHVTELPAVVTTDSAPRYISAGLRGFEERRKAGFGYFLPESTLRKHDSEPMMNMLMLIPGLNVGMTGGVKSARVTMGCSGKGVTVYQDGIISQGFDFSRLPVTDYGAVEYYAGGATAPMWVPRTLAGCGVLMLWTRER